MEQGRERSDVELANETAHHLVGWAQVCLPRAAVGKKIRTVELWPADPTSENHDLGEQSDSIHFIMDGGFQFRLRDTGQDCCESRYMTADGDDLKGFWDAELYRAETRDAVGPGTAQTFAGEAHDIQFLVVSTSKGDMTLSSHNEHNGYYGGFSINVEVIGGDGGWVTCPEDELEKA